MTADLRAGSARPRPTTAVLLALVVAGSAACGSEAARPTATTGSSAIAQSTDPAPRLDCPGMTVVGTIDHEMGAPGHPGTPEEVVRTSLWDFQVRDGDDLTVHGSATSPGVTVSVRRDGRVVALARLMRTGDGGLLVSGHESCHRDR